MSTTDKITGRVKQAAGDLTGDAELRRSGVEQERTAELKREQAEAQERAERTRVEAESEQAEADRKAAEVEQREHRTAADADERRHGSPTGDPTATTGPAPDQRPS